MVEPALLGQAMAMRAQVREERIAGTAAEQEGLPGRSQAAEVAAEVAEETPKAAEVGLLQRLRLEQERLQADMAVLCRCLRKRGLFSDVEWHRERFEQEKRRTGWSPGDETLQTALAQQPPAGRATVAGFLHCAEPLRCTSQSLRSSLDAIREERLFVVGGEAYAYPEAPEAFLKSSESFAEQAGAWQPLPAMGWARTGHAGAALGGSIFVCGGDAQAVRTSVMRFNPQDERRRWRFVRPMGAPRSNAAAAAVGPWLYVCGGRDGPRFLNSAERFRPGTGQDERGEWEALPAMAARREGPAAVALQGHLFVSGGLDGASPPALSSVERFSPSRTSWQGLPSMTRGRYLHAAAVLHGRVYAAGGEGAPYGRPLASVELYDPATGAWSASVELPLPRAGHAAAVLAGRLYFCGGRSGPAPYGTQEPGLSSVERFDPETGDWEAMPPMSQARLHCCAAVISTGPFVAQ